MSIVGVFTMPVVRRQAAWCAVALSGRLTAGRQKPVSGHDRHPVSRRSLAAKRAPGLDQG
jgi:hypothetical protein